MKSLRTAVLIFVVFLVSGCASVYSPQDLQSGEMVRSGRFSMLIQDAKRPDEFLQGRFYWQDLQRGLTLDLSSPVGVTLARIQVQPSQSILQVPGEDAVVAPTADELFTQVFTEPVPIQAMRDWMQGRLSQSLQAFQIKRDSEMRVTSFRAAQWFVTLSRYDDQGPTLMTMTQKTNQRAVTLKLIVDAQP
jgi:outer membrane biogenesis lipoprotein LolB